MTVSKPQPTTSTAPAGTTPANRRAGREWLTSWNPQDPAAGDTALAWRTLSITTYTLTLGFVTWFLVSALAPKLNGLGFGLSKPQLYWLAAVPGLAGGLLRLVWTFLPPILGTRRLVTYSTAMLLVPLVGWALAVRSPDTPYPVLLALAFLAGIGGGVFSGFMPSTSYFFPKAKQGTALGLQAGIGNFGVSLVQFVTPWVVGFALLGSTFGGPQQVTAAGTSGAAWYQNAGWLWVPFVAAGVALAWFGLRSVPVQARGVVEQLDIFRNRNTWLMTVLYVMTFGTFSGLAAQFGLLITNVYGRFDDAPDPVRYAFLGPLVGSAARVVAGPIADRIGGGRLSLVSGLGIAAAAAYTARYLDPAGVGEFDNFLYGMLAIFVFTGIGNASTFKQMPMIFEPRQAGSVIGWTAAIAAFGPFLFGIALAAIDPAVFFLGVAGFALVGAVIAGWYYARPGCEKPC